MSSLEKEILSKIEKHKGVIFKISMMYMDNEDDRKDLFQEIVYQSWKSYENFQGKSEFSTWLYKIALNTAMVVLKKEKKRDFISHQEIETLNVHHEGYNDKIDEKMKMMYSAIRQLSPIDKILIFYFLEDYSGKQIADQLGISEGNVRVKMNRAKTKLKELIANINID